MAPIPPLQPHRRIHVVDGACYCPVGVTEFRRPTQASFSSTQLAIGFIGMTRGHRCEQGSNFIAASQLFFVRRLLYDISYD
jgi:hypothetical protein